MWPKRWVNQFHNGGVLVIAGGAQIARWFVQHQVIRRGRALDDSLVNAHFTKPLDVQVRVMAALAINLNTAGGEQGLGLSAANTVLIGEYP